MIIRKDRTHLKIVELYPKENKTTIKIYPKDNAKMFFGVHKQYEKMLNKQHFVFTGYLIYWASEDNNGKVFNCKHAYKALSISKRSFTRYLNKFNKLKLINIMDYYLPYSNSGRICRRIRVNINPKQMEFFNIINKFLLNKPVGRVEYFDYYKIDPEILKWIFYKKYQPSILGKFNFWAKRNSIKVKNLK